MSFPSCRRVLLALCLAALVASPVFGQAVRRHAPASLPSAPQLASAISDSQALVRAEMPWRSGEAISQPELIAPLIWMSLAGDGADAMRAWVRSLPEWLDYQRTPEPEAPRPPTTGANAPIAGRLRVVHGLFANDAGFFGWHGISEFDAIHVVRTGREADLVRRLDRAAAAGRDVVRVLSMARILFDLRPDQPGYWEALDRVFELAAERGQYVELVLFADAQIIMPDPDARRDHVQAMARRYGRTANVFWSLCNEPFKNGFSEADDPDLLHLADVLASEVGHRDFIIGDPRDGETKAETEKEFERFRAIAKRSNVLALHSSRTEASPGDPRWRRWLDHLKILAEIVDDARKVNPNVVGVHNEPMGAASTRQPGRRDNEPEAFVAAALLAASNGTGFTYHYISAEDDATPGLASAAVARTLPVDPAWYYRNDSTGGDAATKGFRGADKMRTWTDGHRAYVVAYGRDSASFEPLWANGYRPIREVYRGPHVVLWYAER